MIWVGCSLEQEGGNFYIVGADSVRKKLAESPEYSVLDCGNVDFKEHEFGQWHHGYHFTKVSEIPNFGSMVHGKDFFIEVYNGGTNQENVGIGVSYVKHSNSELVMTSVNGLKSLNVKVYYISNRAIPSPSSFLKSVDFTIASGTATKNILLQIIFFALNQHLQCKNSRSPAPESSRPNPYLMHQFPAHVHTPLALSTKILSCLSCHCPRPCTPPRHQGWVARSSPRTFLKMQQFSNPWKNF